MIRRRGLLDTHHLTEREEKNFMILDLIRRHGPITRTELSQGTNLNIVTISNYVGEFIKQGLVVERGFDVSTGGRKPVLVELNAKAAFAIGIDVGLMGLSPAAEMVGVIIDLRGATVHRVVKPRPVESMDHALACAGDVIRDLIATSPIDPKKIAGAAIGVGGILDERAGTIRDTCNRGIRTNYLGLQSRWESEFGLPVFLGNDASLAAYGEYRLGLDRSVENMVYLYSDVGAGLVFHGHLYWGSCGSAGEVGIHISSDDDYLHWIKSPGFVLSNVWDLGIRSQARKLIEDGNTSTITELVEGKLETISVGTVIQAAQANDKVACELLEHCALQLGIRIASFVNLLNPDVVVIGGGIEKAGSLLLEPVWRAVKRYAYEEPASLVDILPGKLGDNAVALGAASWVVHEVFVQV